MAQVELTARTLPDLDNGLAGLMIDRALRATIADLEDRGAEDGAAREVVIRLRLAIREKRVFVVPTVTTKIPAHRANATISDLRIQAGKPVLNFQPHNAEEPEQNTFPEMEQ